MIVWGVVWMIAILLAATGYVIYWIMTYDSRS